MEESTPSLEARTDYKTLSLEDKTPKKMKPRHYNF